MKKCSRCSQAKPLDQFSPLKKAKDGLHSSCKACLAEARRADRAVNKERYQANEAQRHLKDGEARRARNRAAWPEYAAKNAAAIAAKREEKRDQYNAARRDRISSDPALQKQVREAYRSWAQANRDAISAKRRADWAAATPTQRIRSYFGSAISHALRGVGKGGKSWQELVGYRAEALKLHLERQFTKGMTWDNYGEWHVDHIVAASSFTYYSPQDAAFRACWALSNLRPMWAGDNIRKRHHRTHLI